MADILVIGSFVTDMVAAVRRFPEAGETVLGSALNVYPGGKGANQAVAAARLGGDVAMAGMVGDDENGRMFLSLLDREGIDRQGVAVSPELPTSVAQVQLDAAGQNRIVVVPGANHGFTPDYVCRIEPLVKAAKLVVLQLELPLASVEEGLRLAKKHGKKVLINPAPAAKLSADILAAADYLTPNESELSALSGLPVSSRQEASEAAKSLLAAGTGHIVATLGASGALICDPDEIRFVPAFKVEAVDTVGAGDSFNGALAVALCEGKALADAVVFASAMGALTVTKKGAIPSLHTRAEVEKFLRARGK